ncbi:MAG: c-type cytochrome [Betaproteobacteria bacterium]|nr:c-type cytochrome [Betaproteobacteria bacterium]MBL8534108.1 c-type cytochrome [Betaproteobacteria bacterium]
MTRTRIAVCLATTTLLVAVSAHAAAKGDSAKGQAAAAACAACHGPDGNSMIPTNPSLAQQHPEYIAKQLAEFKSGTRANPIMAGMAAMLTPESMNDVGAFFGQQKLRHAGTRDKDLAAKGQKLYRGGDTARGIPACSGCHSPSGAGIPAQYPRLGGQHQEYTAAQLKAFRAGERANDANSMMRAIAAKLSDAEISALSEYVAGLK